MKILGLSFGKKNANCDILTKEALYGAREAYPDAEIKFINTQRLNIGRCIGCGACHDVSAINWVLDKRRSGEMPGDPDEFPQERLKRRTVSYISVGGASTENWTSMGTASLHLFGFPAMMQVVANYNAYSMGTVANPYLDDELIERMHEIGKRTAAAFEMNPEDVEFYAPQGTGTCPVCHQNLLTVNGTTTVECPICGIEGKIAINGDKLEVTFSEEQQARARGTFKGLREHTTEIQGFGAICAPKIMANKELLDEKMDRIKNFEKYIEA